MPFSVLIIFVIMELMYKCDFIFRQFNFNTSINVNFS